MWQIVTVAVLGVRINAVFVPLIARAGLIVAIVVTSVLVQVLSGEATDQATIVLPALLLVCVAALASLPLPASVPVLVPALAESMMAALVVGSASRGGGAGDRGEVALLFLLYLVVPLFTAATSSGLGAGLACSGTAAIVLAAVSRLSGVTFDQYMPSLLIAGFCIFLGVPAVGAWTRRVAAVTAPDSEMAYADAHRLLTDLQVVARQLSLGLDPRTLAAALADDIKVVVPQGSAAVLGRSPAGRFVALSGDEAPEEAVGAADDAWTSGTPMGRDTGGRRYTAVPVLMAGRVVALVLITTDRPVEHSALRSCQALIAQSGPRLASAMLFDDVRRLATTDERMRLAREIHDGIAQDLASVGYLLDDIRRDTDDDVAARVGHVREQLQAMVADLRMSIFDLRSGVDDAIGLGTALSEHAQRVGGQAGLVVHVSMDESPKRLPISVEVELLRIVQEAITNVRRHARATNLWISVTVEPPAALITVTDDGRGLRTGRADSFGITGMRERARRIGARLTVGAGPEGRGTMVEIALGTDPRTPRTIPVLPRTTISRATLTDPHGIPALRAATGTPAQRPTPVPPATPARAGAPTEKNNAKIKR